MKRNIGKALALYPAPLIVVGSMVDGKPNVISSRMQASWHTAI